MDGTGRFHENAIFWRDQAMNKGYWGRIRSSHGITRSLQQLPGNVVGQYCSARHLRDTVSRRWQSAETSKKCDCHFLL